MSQQQNVLDLLNRREKFGVRNQDTVPFSGINHRKVHCRDLSIVSAWNSKRLQNMILAVGPGTPASILMGTSSLDTDDEDDDDDDDDEHSHISVTLSADTDDEDESEQRRNILEEGSENRNENWSDSLSGRKRYLSKDHIDEESDGQHNVEAASKQGDADADEYSSTSSIGSQIDVRPVPQSSNFCTRILHGGCINTAAWIDCPWRLSTACTDENSFLNSLVNSSSNSSNSTARQEESGNGKEASPKASPSQECPTQIITSGDCRSLKIWDVSLSMGTVSPESCATTHCPFAYSNTKPTSTSLVNHWVKRYGGRVNRVPGGVNMLASMRTGHRGNVFHATPLFDKPGNVLTCAADGLLNLCNIETEAISIILASEGSLKGMCFSHHMLDQNTGLICSESGLRRFDLRVPRLSQSSDPLLGDDMCKSCAIYSALDAESSAYVFVGGLSSEVGLYDLRFLGESSKIVKTYRPSCFDPGEDVAVSGIDISKDRKELLVSYENDQIYTFPVFPSHATDPSVDEMLSLSKVHEDQSESKKIHHNHFAGYGGHLNRFTFLKCAKYAGPNDEYICTGSDSGHAFIYDKFSGSTVSLLKADDSTCNGIIPHPTLPIFVTYGIASTAKVWRATMPVDDQDDDSIRGRRRAFQEQEYKKSSVVSRWTDLSSSLAKLSSDEHLQEKNVRMLPNEYPLRSVSLNGRVFEGLPESFFRSLFHQNPFNPGSDAICNDLKNLPEVVRFNYHEAVTSEIEDDEAPVKCGLNELHRRVGGIRLCHQAQQIGLKITDYDKPWDLEPIHLADSSDGDTSNLSSMALIPQYPGDWLPYDGIFTNKSDIGGRALNKQDYDDFYFSRYTYHSLPFQDAVTDKEPSDEEVSDNSDTDEEHYDASKAWDVLFDIIKKLKEEGNKALKEGLVHFAARHYDKAIVYCAVAFMEYPQSNLDFVTSHQKLLSKNAGHSVRWTALLKTFISTRLNLSMTLLKKEISDPGAAYTQAFLALKDLLPFCTALGVVLTGEKCHTIRENEPIETFKQAKELQVKAYFRLGSAKLQSGDPNLAMQNFDKCLSATKEIHPDAAPDKMVLHRLAEAKRLSAKQNKRRRKKFKTALEEHSKEEGESS